MKPYKVGQRVKIIKRGNFDSESDIGKECIVLGIFDDGSIHYVTYDRGWDSDDREHRFNYPIGMKHTAWSVEGYNDCFEIVNVYHCKSSCPNCVGKCDLWESE